MLELVRSDGDGPSAVELFRKGLAVAGRHGDRIAAAECLEGMAATLAYSPGELQQAASLLGTAHALREAAGAPVPPAELQRYERDVGGVREGLGEGAFAEAWEEGRRARSVAHPAHGSR